MPAERCYHVHRHRHSHRHCHCHQYLGHKNDKLPANYNLELSTIGWLPLLQSKVGPLEIQEFLNKTSFMGFTPGKRLMSPLSKSGKGGSWSARERPHAGRVNSRASLRLGRSLVNYNETYRSNVRHKPQTLPLYLRIWTPVLPFGATFNQNGMI